MAQLKRRHFVRTLALGLAAGPLISRCASSTRPVPAGEGNLSSEEPRKEGGRKNLPFSLGLASYTFREFRLDQTIEMTKKLGLAKITLKSFHLPLESREEEIRAAAQKVRDAGLDLYGCGVIYMTNEKEVGQAFGYARTAGIRTIIGVPNPELLPLVEKNVREFGIRLAIHNHGPEDKLYPTPASAFLKIKSLDRRIGLCVDVGHTMRAGIDPSREAKAFSSRLFDVHIKDVSAASKEGQTVEMGRGVVDIPRFIRTLIKQKYSGTLAFEFEKDEKDPLPGVAESVGYLRGVMAAL